MPPGRLTLPLPKTAPPPGDADVRGESVSSQANGSARGRGQDVERTGVVTDRELLQRFLSARDPQAFRQLVERHGGLVLGTASRVLRDRHLAEDAFQATFLVLARKGATIRRRTSIAAWLHGVARRIALRGLRARYRRGETELNHELTMDASPLALIGSQWEQQVLDEELQQLPEAWRDALILHELEGLTCQATADRLGLTLTALEGRLKRGRKELKHRLLRRGIGAGAVLAGLQAAEASGACQPSADLILAAVEASLGTNPATVTSQTADALNTSHHLATQELMAMTTVKTSTLVAMAGSIVVAAGLLGGGWQVSRTARGAGGPPDHAITLLVPEPSPASVQAAEQQLAFDPNATGPSSVTPTDTPPGTAAEQTQRANIQSRDYKATNPNVQRIADALEQKVDLEFIDTELSQVIQFLTDRYQIPILSDSTRLTEYGVTMDQPISLVLSDVSVESALNLILEQVDLDYIVRNEVLQITTREFAEEHMETRVYELRRLPATFKPEDVARVIVRTVRPDSWGENPWVYIVPTPAEGAAGGAGAMGGMLGAGSGDAGSGGLGGQYGGGMSGSPMKPVVQGKKLGAIETLPGCLIVTHCQRAHREIAELLDQLHRMPPAPPLPATGAPQTVPGVRYGVPLPQPVPRTI